MERKEFLKKTGLSGMAMVAVYLSGCSQDNLIPASQAADLTLDLSAPENEALHTNERHGLKTHHTEPNGTNLRVFGQSYPLICTL